MVTVSLTTFAAPTKKSHSWNAFEADFDALGGAAISSKSNSYKAPSEDNISPTASYRVAFTKAGKYDLYVRCLPGSFYFSEAFGETPQWKEVKNIKGPKGEYVWVNLSEKLAHKKTGDIMFDVNEPGSMTFKIASRTRGTSIDAFVFGKAAKAFTDAQLSAAVLGHPAAKTAGLVGFQAEAAAAYGNDVLSDAAQKMQNEYAIQLSQLTREIQAALPTVTDAGKTELLTSLKNELAPIKSIRGLGNTLKQFRTAEDGLLAAKEKLRVAPASLLAAEKRLKDALSMPDSSGDKAAAVESAKKSVDGWKKNLAKLPRDVKKKQGFFDKANKEMAALLKKIEAAKDTGKVARMETVKVLNSLDVNSLLSSSKLDSKLAQYTVIAQATPRALGRYAAGSNESKANLDELFSNTALMLEMLVADGATDANYGEAMRIFKGIQKIGSKAKDGQLRRLALAVALVHATPMGEASGGEGVKRIKKIDPIKRYLSYEKAFLDGKLDPAFSNLTVWELKMVVDSNHDDASLEWGREMMRSYRPAIMKRAYTDQRYAHIVDQEIQYTSQFVKEDKPELKNMQNLLANGGICGRRAFFGRFVLKSFGIPTAARPEPGHATLAYYTPDNGWQAYLGSQWGSRARVPPYGRDMHFLLSTLAREDESNFLKVKRAQLIGEAIGEPRIYGLHGGESPGLWHSVAIAVQDGIADQVKANREKDSSRDKKPEIEKTVITDDDRKVVSDSSGVITIPAVATKIPEQNTAIPGWGLMEIVTFTESNLGGKQLHFSRYGSSQTLEYTFDVSMAGKYELTSRMASSRWDMSLLVSVNDASPVTMAIPFNSGLWDTSKPVTINLKAGSNTLVIARSQDMRKGIAIKDFTLTPAK